MTRSRRVAVLLGALLLAGSLPVSAQGGHDAHAGHTMPGQSAPMSMEAMNAGMLAALRPLRGRAFDVKWAQLMMDHHQMALDMAGKQLASGKDARAKAEARKVIAAQQKEIALLGGWVRKWTGQSYRPASMPMTVPAGMSTDRWFLTEMIPHHQGAIDMSRLAPARGGSSGVKSLAGQIIKAQAAEIATYRQLLKSVK